MEQDNFFDKNKYVRNSKEKFIVDYVTKANTYNHTHFYTEKTVETTMKNNF